MQEFEKINRIVEYFQQSYRISPKPRDPFKTLIACMLSQRTTEENSERACSALFRVASTPEAILRLSSKQLQKLIRVAGFWRQKAKRIKRACELLLKRYAGKVPKEREELLKLPGVGQKTADVVLMYGHGIPSIAIDTHCQRIPKRMGLVPKSADIPAIKQRLEQLFPREYWYLVNLGFVYFGKTVCKPLRPRCELCPFEFCASRQEPKQA